MTAASDFLSVPLAHAAPPLANATQAREAVEIPLEVYLNVLKQVGAIKAEALQGDFANVVDVSEWTPKKADMLYRRLGTQAHLVLTNTVSATSPQEVRAIERNERFLKDRFGLDHVHSAGDDALQAVRQLQVAGIIQGSVAAFSEGVNSGFTDIALDFSKQVDGTTLRFKNQELQNAGIRIDLAAYAIPLVKLLGEATKKQVDDILALFNLKKDGRGEVSVGMNFVTAIAALYAQYGSKLRTAASA